MAEILSESNSPSKPVWNVPPRKFRDTIQSQIQNTINTTINPALDFTIGKMDGRYLLSEPVSTIRLNNDEGYFYHVVGESVMGDASVAAP